MVSNDDPASRVPKKRAGRKRLPPLAPGPALQFVVANHPDDFRADKTMRHIRSHVMYKHREVCQGRSQSPSNRTSTQRSSSSSSPLGRTPSPVAASGSIPGARSCFAAAGKCGGTGVDAELHNVLLQSSSASPVRNLITRILSVTTSESPRSALPVVDLAPDYPFPGLYRRGGESFEELKEEYINNCELCQDRIWLAAIFQSNETFLSGVSANCVYLDASEGLLEDSPLTVYTKAKVLHLVKERLQDHWTATDNHTALSILHLLISEIGGSDEDVFDVHHQGLGRIVHQRGGLRNFGLDGHVATLISIVVLSFAILRGYGEPRMLQGFYPPHPSLPGLMTKPPPISPLFAPNGDTSMLYGICSQATYEIVADMHELTRLFLLRCELNAPFHQPSAEGTSYETHMQQIYNHLLLRPLAEDSVTPDWTYEACRLTALIYCRSIVQRASFSDSGNLLLARGASSDSTGTTIITALHNSINHTDRTNNWANLYGVFLWVCLVGGAASWPLLSAQSMYSEHQTAQAGMAWTRKCFALLAVKSSLAGGFEQAAAVMEAQRKMLRVQDLVVRQRNMATR